MVSAKSILCVVAALSSVVSAANDGQTYFYSHSTFAVAGCKSLITATGTLFNATTDKKGFCNVDNQQALGTMAHCIEGIPYKDARANFLLSCKKYKLTEKEYLAAYDNATQYLTNTKEVPKFKIKALYYKPFYLPQVNITGAWESEVQRYFNFTRAHFYGIALMSYWYAIVLVAGLINLTYFVFPGFIKSLKGNKAVNAYRKYVSLPALVQKAHAHHVPFLKFFSLLIPTRLESILVFIWVSLAIIFTAVNYKYVEYDLFWAAKGAQLLRYTADRSGVMVLWLIPQLILFSGRNNFLIWVSGWPQSRFILLHKWVARISFCLIVVHGVGLTINGKMIGKYYSRNMKSYMQWGYVATVAVGVIIFQSFMVFRKTNYELFLAVHIVLAVFFIVGGWKHTADQGYQEWYYAASALWAFDRTVRVCRLLAFGNKPAQVQLISNETLRVTLPRPAYWKPFPGCIAFIHFLRPTCFWQSHPFTIVDSVTDKNTITFYLKVKGGLTHGLYRYLSTQPSNTATIRVSIEGPYGNPSSINRYENMVFISGGTGIPALYSHALATVQKNVTKQSVKLYWIIRHYRSLEWFYTELLKLEDTGVEVVVYVTQPLLGLTEPIAHHTLELSSEEEEEEEAEAAEKKSDSQESEDYVEQLKQKLHFVQFKEGRPDIQQIVESEVNSAGGPLAFMTCAHGSVVDDARRAVAQSLDKSQYRIELYEELQGW